MSVASAAKIIAVALALAIRVVLTYAVFCFVGQERKQRCIEEAQARYRLAR